MKSKLPLLLGAAFLAFAAGACEGPRGPVGPAGPKGPDGEQGPRGAAGLDVNMCSDCHTADQHLVTIEQQFASSAHGFGNYELRGPDYAGGACVSCHTSQGFEAAVTGETPDWTGGAASMNCRTCHQIHTSYTERDLALTTTDPVDLMIDGTTVDLGPGNLCANCHQGRVPEVIPAIGGGGQDTIPSHYGTHHGPQTTVFAAGPGLPVFPGSAEMPSGPFDPHLTFDGTETRACVGCHMQPAYGGPDDGAGSHTWRMTYQDGGSTQVLNAGTCDACHADVTADFNGLAAEVDAALDDLGACLLAEGVVDSTGEAITGAVVDDDLLAGYLIWQTLTEDGSHGAHQPMYVPAILSNTNEYLDAHYTGCAP